MCWFFLFILAKCRARRKKKVSGFTICLILLFTHLCKSYALFALNHGALFVRALDILHIAFSNLQLLLLLIMLLMLFFNDAPPWPFHSTAYFIRFHITEKLLCRINFKYVSPTAICSLCVHFHVGQCLAPILAESLVFFRIAGWKKMRRRDTNIQKTTTNPTIFNEIQQQQY